MLDSKEKFGIIKEVNNLYPRINLTQLLSASPSIRKDLEQGCKPRIKNILYAISKTYIPIIIGKINDILLRMLFDTGVNVNINYYYRNPKIR